MSGETMALEYESYEDFLARLGRFQRCVVSLVVDGVEVFVCRSAGDVWRLSRHSAFVFENVSLARGTFLSEFEGKGGPKLGETAIYLLGAP